MAVDPTATTRPPDWHAREWRHCVLTTYGSWLYGDARGFRTRHHRQHVDGDYRHPPLPGKFAREEKRSRESLKSPVVVLPKQFRGVVGVALIERLSALDAFVLCAAVGGQHVHLLAKLRKKSARALLGEAKRHAWFQLSNAGWQGRLWGKRGRANLVRDKRHHANTYRYILDHAREAAWIWVNSEVQGNRGRIDPGGATPGLDGRE
jgi:hypothetical protein